MLNVRPNKIILKLMLIRQNKTQNNSQNLIRVGRTTFRGRCKAAAKFPPSVGNETVANPSPSFVTAEPGAGQLTAQEPPPQLVTAAAAKQPAARADQPSPPEPIRLKGMPKKQARAKAAEAVAAAELANKRF